MKKKKLFCAFVDFEKAFDTVTREAICGSSSEGKFVTLSVLAFLNALEEF